MDTSGNYLTVSVPEDDMESCIESHMHFAMRHSWLFAAKLIDAIAKQRHDMIFSITRIRIGVSLGHMRMPGESIDCEIRPLHSVWLDVHHFVNGRLWEFPYLLALSFKQRMF